MRIDRFFSLVFGLFLWAATAAAPGLAAVTPTADTDEIPNGVVEMRTPDGRLSSRMTYKDGMLDGPFEKYNPDGTLAEVRTYRRDKLNGPARRYYPDGRIAEEVGYVDGLLDGPHLQHDPDGKQMVEAVYDRGKPAGSNPIPNSSPAIADPPSGLVKKIHTAKKATPIKSRTHRSAKKHR